MAYYKNIDLEVADRYLKVAQGRIIKSRHALKKGNFSIATKQLKAATNHINAVVSGLEGKYMRRN